MGFSRRGARLFVASLKIVLMASVRFGSVGFGSAALI